MVQSETSKAFPPSDHQVEGDILLLDTDTGHELRYPRAPAAVDMSKQLGRDDGDVDDFEELVLSPKRPSKRPSCFVDMAKDGISMNFMGSWNGDR